MKKWLSSLTIIGSLLFLGACNGDEEAATEETGSAEEQAQPETGAAAEGEQAAGPVRSVGTAGRVPDYAGKNRDRPAPRTGTQPFL